MGKSGIKIRKFRISITTVEGDYGFECSFKEGLNIVRGNNTSGKSTLINAIIYSLGMEEIIGGKGEKTLPYVLKEYVENNETRKQINVESSNVHIEISNKNNEIVTIRRAVKSQKKDTKLVEIIEGAYLTFPEKEYKILSTFLHDKKSAQNVQSGFFAFLENFMSLKLPTVSRLDGKECKLYLQTIFSALFIEQKQGWTDYIANTPYYAIGDVRTKIVQFLLGLDVFEHDKEREALLSKMNKIRSRWSEELAKVNLIQQENSVYIQGVMDASNIKKFNVDSVKKVKIHDDLAIELNDYILELIHKIENIEKNENEMKDDVSEELLNKYKVSKGKLEKLVFKLDLARNELGRGEAELNEYKIIRDEIEKDLEKNKIAQKLKEFGAEKSLNIACDNCPTCNQKIKDSLLIGDNFSKPMSIDSNIKYLEDQKKMVVKFVNGLEKTINKLRYQLQEITKDIANERSICLSLKKELRVTGSPNQSDIKLKLQLEMKVERLNLAVDNIDNSLSNFKNLNQQYKTISSQISHLSKYNVSGSDTKKHKKFQKYFIQYITEFGYKSDLTSNIEINKVNLLPYLSGMEFRGTGSIKSDSSASDFVRLIWAYLLAIYSTSNDLGGNHAGLLILDEPGQHSMGISSINSLFKVMASQADLQGIVAASFDEKDDVFEESLANVNYNLINIGDRLLKPV